MNYQVTFPHRIDMQGEMIRRGDGNELCSGYHLDLTNLLRLGEGKLVADAADLIDVMFAATKTDRTCPRGRVGHLAPRNLDVRIPVRQPDLWSSSSVTMLLEKLLHWLSGDFWSIKFTRRLDRPSPGMLQLSIRPLDDTESTVILNSGGLDSLIGIAERKSRIGDHRLIAVTSGKSELITRAAKLVNYMDTVSSGGYGIIQSLSINEGLTWPNQSRDQQESSWRTRALLPLAVGAATTRVGGTAELHVFENGIGAIALPLTGDHQGVGATRSMHPRTLHLFSQLASAVFENQFRVVNNGLFLTKRQGMLQFFPSTLARAVHATASCPQWVYSRQPCGRCISCILRCMALRETPFEECGIEYDGQSSELALMAYQVEKLRRELPFGATNFVDRNWEISDAARFATSSGLSDELVFESLGALYLKHVEEFDSFAPILLTSREYNAVIDSKSSTERSLAA